MRGSRLFIVPLIVFSVSLLAFAPPRPRVPSGSPATVAIRLEVAKPDGSLLACDGTDVLTGVGNVIVRGYATGPGQVTIRRDYDPFVAGAFQDPWYGTHTASLSTSELRVFEMVQDLEQAATQHRIVFKAIGIVSTSCEFAASNYPLPTEGTRSARLAGVGGIQVRVDVERYGTGEPIACGATMAAGRIQAQLMARRTTGAVVADWHWHIERTGDPGPDQAAPSSNARFVEEGFARASVGVDWTAVGTFVSDTRPGVNTIHFGQQNATASNRFRVLPEVFCSFTTG